MTYETYFNVHLVSDSTGETLNAVMRAACAQFDNIAPLEHNYYLVRSPKQLDRVLREIEAAPGVVLYTITDEELRKRLEERCREVGSPTLAVIDPAVNMLSRYLGLKSAHKVAGQYHLDSEYFARIETINFALQHDDGQHTEDLREADVVLVGVSRTSKTPTSIYLANRGVKTANFPLIPGMPVPPKLEALAQPLVVGLTASPERIVQIRQNRLLGLRAEHEADDYVNRQAVAAEIAAARKLCGKHNWPIIDVTRRSIEETAAEVMALLADRRRQPAN